MFFTKEIDADWDEYEEEFVEQRIMDFIEEQLCKQHEREPPATCHKRKRSVYDRVSSLEHPETADPKSALGKRFRRRFRMPLPLFLHIVKLVEQHNVFGMQRRSSTILMWFMH